MKKILWIATLSLACAFPLVSQDLSLNQALDLALNNSNTAANASLTLQQKFNDTQVNTYLPSITLSLGGEATASLMNSDYSAGFSPIASVSFSLSDTDKYTRDETELLYKLAQNTYTSTITSLQSTVVTAYWDVVAANLALEIDQLTYDSKQASLDRINEKYEGGLATTLEVSEGELALSNAKIALKQQEQTLANAKMALKNLIGQAVDQTSDDLISPATLQSLETLDAMAQQTSTISTLKLNVEEAKLAYAQENHTAFSPSLSFSATTSFSGSVETTGTAFEDNTTLSVAVSLPVDSYFTKSSTKISLENLQMDITIANNSLEDGIQNLLASVQTAYTALEQAEATLQYLEAYKVVVEKNYELTSNAYEAGEVDYSTLQDIENERSNASLAILQQQVNYTLALYDLSNLLETDVDTLFQ